MIHPNASQIALSAVLPAALDRGRAPREGYAVKRPEPGQEVNLARAERATQAGEWHQAAVLWNELFLRGGGSARGPAARRPAP